MQHLILDYIVNEFMLTIDNPISEFKADCQVKGKFTFAGFSYRYPDFYEVIGDIDMMYPDKGKITVQKTFLLPVNDLTLIIIEPKNKN